MKDLVVFTDGSCIPQLVKACGATVWPDGEFDDQAFFLDPLSPRTSNRAEFLAAIKAGEQADTIDPDRQRVLHIHTDSMLLVNSMTKWVSGWRRNNWKKAGGAEIKNLDLIKTLDSQMTLRETRFSHVRAHTDGTDYNSYWNTRADTCAQSHVRLDAGIQKPAHKNKKWKRA